MTRTATRILAGLLASSALIPVAHAQTLPSGGTVAQGSAEIGGASGGAMTITQASDRAVINWQSFSVGEGGRVRIVQPGERAALLNRVTGTATSEIAGSIEANGRVYLVNPNGILITPTGSVNAGGFVASTLDLGDRQFMDGGEIVVEGRGGSVANHGRISIARGGYAALIGGRVDNSGLIVAPLGKVALGAGTRATLDFEGDGFLQVAMPQAGDSYIGMSGRISADGGSVILAAATARDLARHTVNLDAVDAASGIDTSGGRVELTGKWRGGGPARVAVQPAAGVEVSGRIDSARGAVTVTGSDIALRGATVDVSGASGGGRVAIGGGRKGQGDIAHADTLSVDAASVIRADATAQGKGGDVVLWSDARTDFAGTISARGAGGGDGGEAEVSSLGGLNYLGHADLTGARFGNLLLDPVNITISSAASGITGDESVLNATALVNQLASANVTVSTAGAGSAAGNITVAAPLAWSSGATLTLDATKAIAINAPITVGGAGGLALNYDASNPMNLLFNGTNSARFTGTPGTQSLSINGAAYTLLYSADELAGINTVAGLTGRYALAGPLDLSGRNWLPIGRDAIGNIIGDGFSGTFEGLGNVISNLSVTRNLSAELGRYATFGLFGVVAGGKLRDLHLTGASILGSGPSGILAGTVKTSFDSGRTLKPEVANITVDGTVQTYAYGGGIIGIADGVSLYNLVANVTVGQEGASGSFFGGIAGQFTGFTADGQKAVRVAAFGSISGWQKVGGLFGEFVAGSVWTPLTQAFFAGSLRGWAQVGGLAGNAVASISDSAAFANIVTPNYGAAVGGIAGSLRAGSLTNVLSVSTMIAGPDSVQVGAFAGEAYSAQSAQAATGIRWNSTVGDPSAVGAGYMSGSLLTAPLMAAGALTTSQMTSAANFAGYDFSANGPWGILEGTSMPYLRWLYGNAPTVVSGTAYTDTGATPFRTTWTPDHELDNGYTVAAPAARVTIAADGKVLGNAYTGYDGSFYYLLPTGTLASGGSTIVAAVKADSGNATAAVNGGIVAGGVTGSLTGTKLLGGWLTMPSSAATLTALRGVGAIFDQAVATPGLTSLASLNRQVVTTAPVLTTGGALDWEETGALTVRATAINIDAAVTHAGSGTLGLSATRIAFNAPLTISGTGGLALGYDIADPLNLVFTGTNSARFTGTPGAGQSLSINGESYELLYSMADLQSVDAVGRLGGRYALANSLDGTGITNWRPIGTAAGTASTSLGFTGKFEGLGNSISNLTIGQSTAVGDDVGLFGRAGGASFRDVHLVDFTVQGQRRVGALVGNVTYNRSDPRLQDTNFVIDRNDPLLTTIANITVRANVSGESYVGGLAGEFDAGNVSNIVTYGNIRGSGAGGVIGWSQTVNNGIFYRLASFANVSGANYVGGLLGRLSGGRRDYVTLREGAFYGVVTGIGDSSDTIGGLAGNGISRIVDSASYGPVIGYREVGGIKASDYAELRNVFSASPVYGAVDWLSSSWPVGTITGSAWQGSSVNAYYAAEANRPDAFATDIRGGATALDPTQVRSAASFSGFDFSATGPWGIIEGSSMPYLRWLFGDAPTLISGTVYTDNGVTLLRSPSRTMTDEPILASALPGRVTIAVDGAVHGNAYTNYSGGFSYLLPTGTLEAGGSQVIAAVQAGGGNAPSAVNAGVFANGVTGSLTGLALKGGWLSMRSDAATLTALRGVGATFAAVQTGAVLGSVLTGLQRDVVTTAPVLTTGGALNWEEAGAITVRAAEINMDAAVTHAGSGTLGLSATRIAFNAPLTVSGSGGLALGYDIADPLNLVFSGTSSVRFTGTPGAGQSLSINGESYELLYTMADLQSVDAVGRLGGRYALADSLDGTGITNWRPIGQAAGTAANSLGFTGKFEGLGNSISNLSIGQSTSDGSTDIGLFGRAAGASFRDVHLVDFTVRGYARVGALVGNVTYDATDLRLTDYAWSPDRNDRLVTGIANITVSGSIAANSYVGGLAGEFKSGNVTNVVTRGTVSGSGSGGVIGWADVTSNDAVFHRIASFSTVTGANIAGGLFGGLMGGRTMVVTLSEGAFYGTVTGTGTAGGSFGGLVGEGDVRISDSASYGPVRGLQGMGGIKGKDWAELHNVFSASPVYATRTLIRDTGTVTGWAPDGSATNTYYAAEANISGAFATSLPGGATALDPTQVRSAASFTGFDFGPNGPWGIIEGSSMPYLRWLFGDAPTLISGTVYTDAGTTPLRSPSRTRTADPIVAGALPGRVSVSLGGQSLGYAYLDYSGRYSYLIPTGGLPAGGAPLLVTADPAGNAAGAAASARIVDNVSGTLTGQHLWGNTLTVAGNYGAWSAVAPSIAAVTAGNGGAAALIAGLGSKRIISGGDAFVVDQAIDWAGSGTLRIDADGRLAINAPVTVSGNGGLALRYHYTDAASDFTFARGASVQFTGTPNSGQTLTINGLPYTLIYSLADLQTLNPALTWFALARPLDGASYGNWTPLNSGAYPYDLEGLGNSISNLSVEGTNWTGLFAFNGGTISNLLVENINVRDNGVLHTGGLAAVNRGSIRNVHLTGMVSGMSDMVGGLVGSNENGWILSSSSSARVSGSSSVGGLVGANGGLIRDSYFEGIVTAQNYAGGIAGASTGWIDTSYAAAAVSGHNAGGLIGINNGMVSNAYWNSSVTAAGLAGVASGDLSGVTALSEAAMRQASGFAGFSSLVWGQIDGASRPYLRGLYPSTPQVVSGIAYTDQGSTSAGAGADVSLRTGGARIATLATGANGSFYTLFSAGTVTAPLLATSASGATLTAADALGSIDLWGNWLRRTTPDASLSASNATLAAAVGGNAGVSTFVAGLANLQIATSAASFVFDTALSQSAGGQLYLSGPGAFSQTAALDVHSLRLDGGSYTLATANAVTLAGSAQSLDLTAGDITVQGAVTVSGALSLTGEVLTLANTLSGANPILRGTRLVNTHGADALTATSGRWLVYLPDHAAATNQFGGLDSGNTALFNVASGGAVAAAGNRYVFASQPILTVTSLDRSAIYGDGSDLSSAYAISGYLPGVAGAYLGDTLASAVAGAPSLASLGASVTAAASATPYGITVSLGSLSSASGYGFSFASTGGITVTPRALTVTADALSRIYGEANSALTYAIGGMGLVNGDALTGALTTNATVSSGIDSYAITRGTLAATSNYALSYAGADLTITARPVTVTADALSRIYGEVNPALTYAIGGMGLVNGDALTGGLATGATAASGVGTYAITQGSLAASANYALSYTGADLGITARPITVTGDTLSRIYGEANPVLTYAIGGMGLVNGDTLTGGLTTTASGASGIGGYAITRGSLAASANYTLSYADGLLTVTPRPITITADALSRIYGEANPALTYTIGGMGLVNGDALTGLLATDATSASGVGTYTVSRGTLTASGNYVLSYVAATLGVTPRPITVTADALSRIYGAANPALTYAVGGMGLVNGDALSGMLATGATARSGIGSYAIERGTLAASSNYALGYTGADLGVTPRPIAVTADALIRIYGEANPAFTYAIGGMGLVNGDTLTGALATAADARSGIGAYAVTHGSLAASANYALSYTGADLGITARPITVTGDTLSRIYGEANPTLTYTIGGMGLVNGDTLSGGLTTAANRASGIGRYAITRGLLAGSSNYLITYVDGVLGITPRPITVTADALSRIYGEANPALAYAVGGMGLVNGDALSGMLATEANAGSGIGGYAISQGTLRASDNYLLSYVAATLSVTPRPITISADGLNRIYGEANPTLTYAIGGMGLVNGDTLSGALETTATRLSGIGGYVIGRGDLSAGSNYAIGYSEAVLTVTPRSISVTADALSRIYGAANPVLTYAVGGMGLVNGDTLAGGLATAANSASGIGWYVIGQGTLAASANYRLTFAAAGLTITPRPIVITADMLSRIYGEANPELTYTIGGMGLVDGDILAGSLATAANGISGLGNYTIDRGTLSASNNYVVDYIAGNLAITPRPLLLSAIAASRVYGEANPTLGYTIGGMGLINGDTLTGGLAVSADRTSGVGNYAIRSTLAASGNYVVTYTSADLMVTPRSLLITAGDATRIYGEANPLFGYTVGGMGLINGDLLSGALASRASATSGVGGYAILRGTLGASANYTVEFTGGTFTITPRPISITALPATRYFGDPNPVLPYAIGGMGLVNGDTLSGKLISNATRESPVGNYAILLGTLRATANYVVTFSGASLTVDPARTIAVELRAAQQIRSARYRNPLLNNPFPTSDTADALPDQKGKKKEEEEEEEEEEELLTVP